MTSWLRSPNSRKSLNDWADDVASEVQEKERRYSSGTRHRTPTASTAVDEYLPPPVIHPARRSISPSNRKRKSARFGRLKLLWEEFKSRLGTGSAPCSSSINEESAVESTYHRNMQADSDGAVDEVVVDRIWSEEFHSTLSHSDQEDSPEKSGSNHPRDTTNGSDAAEDSQLLSRVWHVVLEIFSSRFEDERKEKHYQQEDWYVKKTLAIVTSLWLMMSWVLGCAFSKLPGRNYTLADKIFFFAIAPIFTVPVTFMVIYNWPRDRTYIYQVTVLFAVWCWSFYQIIFMRVCGYYTHGNCQDRDFMPTFYYTTGLQTVGLFGLKLNRFPAALGALCFFLFASIAIIPVRNVWIRNMINFFIYHSFIIYVHYIRESSERRLYTLRDQLKIQYKVRVPLNTALLAVQNMGASGTVAKDQEIEFSALSGSLSMMSKVLNDVLDFNRLDSGKFESASKPYAFHQVMRSLFIPLRLATDARGLEFEADLDPNIDKIARRLAYEAMGETQEHARKHILEHPDVDGVVTGDEARLRQIVTNLASNACKFTSSGGKLRISTKLVLPRFGSDEDPLDVNFGADPPVPPALLGVGKDAEVGLPQYPPLSANHLTQHNFNVGVTEKKIEHIVVRIEISDTGCGIKYEDIRHNKLFTAFNQTEQGIQQGGKGTGLGLALVRQIVKLSGGRLGVKSKPDEGSTFWVELPLGVGRRTFATSGRGLDTSTPPSDTSRGQPDASRGDRGLGPRHQLGLFETPTNDKVGVVPSGNNSRMRQAKIRSEAMKEHQALYSLMEQGGTVDLGLRNHEVGHIQRGILDSQEKKEAPRISPPSSEVTVAGADSPDPLEEQDMGVSVPLFSATSATDVPTSPPPGYRIGSISSDAREGADTSALEGDLTPTTYDEGTAAAARRNRPNYVALPTSRTFSSHSMENQPQLTSDTYQTTTSTSSSMSPMTAFDNCFKHGSPASSNAAVNVEPGINVLVVDDDPLTRTLMHRILTRLGCKVTTAENGEMAVDVVVGKKGYAGVQHTPPVKEFGSSVADLSPSPSQIRESSGNGSTEGGEKGLRKELIPVSVVLEELGPVPEEVRFAVVFLDNQMPVMSGVKAVERLRQLGRKDFVVGVTGNALLSDQHEYLNAGVDRILTKPVLERSLREILAAAEDRKKTTTRERRSSLKDSPSSSNGHGPNDPQLSSSITTS